MVPPEPIVTYVDAPDRWRLATYHYPRWSSKKRYPVILVHGFGTNRYDVDFPDPRFSLAKYLYRSGYDVWVIELRGTGRSYVPGLISGPLIKWMGNWSYDDYVFKDLPSLASFILKKTRKKKLHWIGHSLGGTLVYCAIENLGDRVCASAVTLGAAMSASAKNGFVKLLLKIDPYVKKIPFLPVKYLARGVAPFGRWLVPLEDNFFYAIDNVDMTMVPMGLKMASENISSRLFLQLHDWYKSNHFRSENHSFSYRNRLKDIRSPFLICAGSVDGLTAFPDVRFAYDRITSKDKELRVFGKAEGCRTEYGHADLVLGKNAPREVYPVIRDWLDRHD